MKNIKKILLSSILESIGLTALSAAWEWSRGYRYAWRYYPIMILLLFTGITLCKIGFSIFNK